jgi:hypothetical protein
MKKTILILTTIGMLLSSCSSDDGSDNLLLSLNNISGNWYIKSIINSQDIEVEYSNSCSSQRDYIQFYTFYKMEFHQFFSNCNPQSIGTSCTNYYFLEGNIISNCNNLINGKVKVLKTKEMVIDYEEIRNFGMPDNNLTAAKGIILYRD